MSISAPILADELSVREYIGSLNINPQNVYYSRYASTNASPQSAQWVVQSPGRNRLLLSYGQIEWKIRYILEQEVGGGPGTFNYDPTPVQWNDELPGVSFKGIFPMENAASSITVTINGTTLTISQVRNFMEALTTMCVNKEEANKCYENGYLHNQGGLYTDEVPGNHVKAVYLDDGLIANEQSWHRKALEGADKLRFDGSWPPVAGGGFPSGNVITYTSPIPIAPFNPFAKVTGGIPSYLPWGKMSKMIPHIDRLELEYQFLKMSESIFLTRYLQSDGGGNDLSRRIKVTDLDCDLLLYWYQPPDNSPFTIPSSVNIQSWLVREFQLSTAIGALVDPTVPPGGGTDVDSQLIQLRSVPEFVILSCLRDKDVAEYDGTAFSKDQDGDGGVVAGSQVRNSVDYYARFTKVEILMSDRPLVISSTFKAAELYYLTVKNSKYPHPYSQDQWLGSRTPVYTGAAANVQTIQAGAAPWLRQISRMTPVFRSKDMNEVMSPGVFAPTTLQFRTTVLAHHGMFGLTSTAAKAYRLFVHVFDTKAFLTLEPDRASFQLQSVSLAAAKAVLEPSSISPAVGAGLRVGGALSDLRARGIDRYVPRVF